MTLPHDPQGQAQSGHLLLCACANIGVTVDGKVLVVGSRLHHRAGVHRHRPQGQSSPLWPQRPAAWPLVPRSAFAHPRAADARVRSIFFTHI